MAATTVEPVAPEPQADHAHVVPLLNEIEQLRLDLTAAANWLFAHWPADLSAPKWRPTDPEAAYETLRLTYLATTAADLLTAVAAVDGGADPEALSSFPAGAGRQRMFHRRRFGTHVVVDVWAWADVWALAFPGEEAT